MDGTHCRPQLDDKSYSVVDTRNGLALATFERNTRSFTKFGVLRLFASHLTTDNLTFLFMNVIIVGLYVLASQEYANNSPAHQAAA